MKKLKFYIIIAQLIISSTLTTFSYAGADEPVDADTKKAMIELESYCKDVGENPIEYSRNAKDKSIVSKAVEVSKGVIKFDTLIKIDHPNGPDYISCFQHFKTPFQPKSLDDRIIAEEKYIATCKEQAEKGITPVGNLKNNLKKVSEKLTCDESKKTTVAQCADNLTYCGLEHLKLAKALKVSKPKDLACSNLLDATVDAHKNVGECMATLLRGVFDEITDTLKLLAVDGPKWVYGKTIGKFFQEPAVKQMENVGSMEAIASSKASDKDIKTEQKEPEKSLREKIVAFTKQLILEKGAETYGCTKWSTGVPGIGSCVEPAKSWECASCKQKAMTICGVAGYATGMVVETAVLAVPVGIIGGSVIGLAGATGAASKVVKAVKGIELIKDGSLAMKAAKTVAKTGVTVAKGAIKVLAPIGKAGYKIGKSTLAALKLIPGAELTAQVLAKPFKLWMKTDDLLTSKVWNLTYHGSKAYTQTLVKTGNVALAAKSATTATKLNQAQKAGEVLLTTQANIKKNEEKLASEVVLTANDKKSIVAEQKDLEIKLVADQKRYDNLSSQVSAKDIEETRFLESDHAAELTKKYEKAQEEITLTAKAEKTENAAEASKADAVVGVEEKSSVEGPALKLTAREASAEEFAKILAVDEETQKLISDPIIAQYIYLNHFATDAERVELKASLQDIANSAKVGNTDLFALVNKKLKDKLADPAVQAKVKAAFEGNDKTLRPSRLSSATFEAKSRLSQVAKMPETISRLKKIVDDAFSVEVLDEGLFHFYGATQLGLRDSQMRPWELVPGGFSSIRPNQIKNMSPDLWAQMAHFASETEAPIHGYSTNSGDALRGLIPSISRFMGKNEEEYLAHESKVEKAIEAGTAKNADEFPFCTNVWCGEEKRHETAVQRIGEQVTGKAKNEPKTYEADVRGDYLDAEYALKHLVGRNSSEWNANSIYLYMRSHSDGAANKLLDNVRADETKHMAIFATGFKYFYGDQPGLRTKGMIDKIIDLKRQASSSNSSGDVLSESIPALLEVGVTHLFVENKTRQFARSVPLKTMEKMFDTPVKTLTDLETVPLTAEKQKAILEMNEIEKKKRDMLARWTPEQREKYLALKKVEKEHGDLIEGLIQNLFKGFDGAEVYGSKEAAAVIKQIDKLRTGLDPKTNALIQLSLNETLRDYQIMNNKYVRSHPELKVRFKNAQEGFVVEHKAPGEATVKLAQNVTDRTFLLRVQKPEGLELTPGAAVRVEVDTPSGKEWRVLSLASAPNKKEIEFAVGVSDSDFKQAVMKLKPGQSVTLSKAKGSMHFDETKPTVMIAGGIGITPFRSMIQHVKDNKLNTPMHLYYSNSNQIPFGNEFTQAAESMPELSYTEVLSKPNADWKGKTGRIDDKFIANELPNLPKDSKYYIVGPPAMVTGTRDNLVRLGVKPDDIQVEIFALEAPPVQSREVANAGGDVAPAPKEKAVCRCFSVGQSQIIRVIKQGATTVESIAEATGATRGCGNCTCDVEKILQCEIGR
jgi:ferredoxin-NADP reductase